MRYVIGLAAVILLTSVCWGLLNHPTFQKCVAEYDPNELTDTQINDITVSDIATKAKLTAEEQKFTTKQYSRIIKYLTNRKQVIERESFEKELRAYLATQGYAKPKIDSLGAGVLIIELGEKNAVIK